MRLARRTWLDAAVVASLCVAGAAIRLPGLTTRDLWFDDAWAALPSRVGVSDAVHMVVTTPLYSFALRWWLMAAHPTWWAQLPALVFGIAGIAAVFALVRFLGFSRLAAFFCAAVVAAGPITVMYSTRVKEYSFDLLLACLVLWLFERWRRAPGAAGLAWLAAASVLALWTSASTAAVVGGAAAAAIAVGVHRQDVRRAVAIYLGALVAGAALVWLVFLRHLSHQLRTNWRTHGFLFGYSSSRHVAYAFQQTFGGIAHGILGIEIPYTFKGYALRGYPMALAVVTALALGALVALPLVGLARSRCRSVGPTTASGAAVAIAVVGTLSGLVPLGDGRTDEALYPAILLLVAGAGTALWRWVRLEGRVRTVVRATCAVVVGATAVWFGVTHVAEYPPTGLSTVMAQLRPLLRPGDLVVVDGYESFTWGVEHQGPWAVSFRQGLVPWPMGFHVASTDGTYVLSSNYLQPDATFATLSHRTHRLWFVGPNVGGYSTSAPKDLWYFPFSTPTLISLEHLGWKGLAGVCCHYSGTYAELLTHR